MKPRRRAIALAVGTVSVGVQLIPYGWRRPNPPVLADAPWPAPESGALARAACYDCHSNESRWPAWSSVAPASWLVRRDVEAGRDELNFSVWDGDEAGKAADEISDGSMPPRRYQLLHPGARLSVEERDRLVDALRAMGGGGTDGGGRGRGRGRGSGD